MESPSSPNYTRTQGVSFSVHNCVTGDRVKKLVVGYQPNDTE